MVKKAWLFSLKAVVLLILIQPLSSVYGAEVERPEESEVPPEIERAIEIEPELEKAIEIKKEAEFKIMPVADITALGTYSKIAGGNDLGGADIRGFISPAVRLDSKNFIIPLYYGAYTRERQVVVEEEGGRVYNTLMDHNVTIEYKHLPNENITLKADGLMRLHYVKEKGYKWSKGLYDYEDFGASGTIEYALLKTKEQKSSIGTGFEYYHREYPNYQSLIALASTTAPETDEKNYSGYRPMLKYNYLDKNLNCALTYSPLYKDFDDKKVIGTNGVLMDKRREDWFHYANVNLSYLPEASPIAYGLGLTGIIVDSNQNYNDSKGTVTLADDVFTKNYYSFKSIDINPRLTYIYRLKDKPAPATFTVGYAYLIRDYDDRKAQRVDGSYTDENQLDKSHTINLRAIYPISAHISAVVTASYTKATSNMRYETYYRYRYESYLAAAGVRVRY